MCNCSTWNNSQTPHGATAAWMSISDGTTDGCLQAPGAHQPAL